MTKSERTLEIIGNRIRLKHKAIKLKGGGNLLRYQSIFDVLINHDEMDIYAIDVAASDGVLAASLIYENNNSSEKLHSFFDQVTWYHNETQQEAILDFEELLQEEYYFQQSLVRELPVQDALIAMKKLQEFYKELEG